MIIWKISTLSEHKILHLREYIYAVINIMAELADSYEKPLLWRKLNHLKALLSSLLLTSKFMFEVGHWRCAITGFSIILSEDQSGGSDRSTTGRDRWWTYLMKTSVSVTAVKKHTAKIIHTERH